MLFEGDCERFRDCVYGTRRPTQTTGCCYYWCSYVCQVSPVVVLAWGRSRGLADTSGHIFITLAEYAIIGEALSLSLRNTKRAYPNATSSL